jgi:putative ABC transport system permease protein
MGRFASLMLKNCWRNRRRTVLTILSIGASLSLLGVLMAIYYAFYFSESTPEQALRVATRHKVSLAFAMPESYGPKIKRLPGVKEVMMQNWFGGIYKDSRPQNMFARFAVEPEKLFTVRPEMIMPDDQKKAFVSERTACILGKPLADRLGLKLGDRITIKGDIFQVVMEFTLRGIYDADQGNEVLYFHRKYLEEAVGARAQGQTGMFVIMADSTGAVPRIARAIDDEFRNSPVPTRSEPERAFQLSFINSLGNVKAFLVSICAAVTFTMLLVCANTMAMSVRERVREVGILKTLGFTTDKILGLILGEAAMLSLIGAGVGLVLASGLCSVVRQAPSFASQLKTLSVQPPIVALCLGVALLIGVGSAAVPAWGAARTSILEAIRSSD